MIKRRKFKYTAGLFVNELPNQKESAQRCNEKMERIEKIKEAYQPRSDRPRFDKHGFFRD